MPGFLIAYVRFIERVNYLFGRLAMFLLFALMSVLLWGSIARAGWHPQIWTDEMAQFILMGYFMLGGAYAMQLGSAVRMDLLYGRWSDTTKAAVDAITIFALIFYLGVLLWGGIDSTIYSLEYGERRRGLWRLWLQRCDRLGRVRRRARFGRGRRRQDNGRDREFLNGRLALRRCLQFRHGGRSRRPDRGHRAFQLLPQKQHGQPPGQRDG